MLILNTTVAKNRKYHIFQLRKLKRILFLKAYPLAVRFMKLYYEIDISALLKPEACFWSKCLCFQGHLKEIAKVLWVLITLCNYVMVTPPRSNI